MKRTWPLITTVALAAILLAGCSAGDSTPKSDGSAQQASIAETTTAGDATASGQPAEQAQGESGAGVDTVDTSKVLAEQVHTIPGTQDKTTFGVLSLKVKGKTMVLKMAMTPDFQSMSQSDAVSVYKMAGEDTLSPTLLDREHLKEYSIPRDGAKEWATDVVYTKTTNGEPAVWWGVYAAPEDDIKAVDIRVLDGMPEFTNVPIQR